MNKITVLVLIAALLMPAMIFAQRGTTQTTPVSNFNLTVNVTPNNVGAKIFIDNTEIKGNVATVRSGTHSIKVTAPGYQDFNSSVNVTANMTVPVTLVPLTANLTIAVTPGNVGAKIYINNAEIKGNTMTLPLGNYAVKVTAPNYLDYNTTVNLTRNTTLPVTLQPATATVNVVLQQTSRAKELVNNYLTQMSVYVDGVKQNLPGNATSFVILSGQRNVRIVSGAMQAEINFNFLPGKVYTIEPVYTLIIRE
ncbi:MAG: PEGA domain-containing protein [Spirochaetes bacterium]|nr:PEGA domain-containing protein [Spirochaetota bacterium]MBU0956124.1 PEGA domain-containing protein [Spirochaetota bacterium]